MSGDAALLALEGRGFPENEGIASALWQESSHEIASALHSPFVKGLADGSLPRCVCACHLMLLQNTALAAQTCWQYKVLSTYHTADGFPDGRFSTI